VVGANQASSEGGLTPQAVAGTQRNGVEPEDRLIAGIDREIWTGKIIAFVIQQKMGNEAKTSRIVKY
jgi:hypothetical protein